MIMVGLTVMEGQTNPAPPPPQSPIREAGGWLSYHYLSNLLPPGLLFLWVYYLKSLIMD